MTPTETDRLLALVVAIQPGTPIIEHTSDAWHLVLGHLPFALASDAVVSVARRVRFIAPSDVVQEARRLADERAQHVDPLAVPDADPDDPPAYLAALRAGRMVTPDPTTLHPRPVAAALRHALEARQPA